MPDSPRFLVIVGIGQSLRGDDAAGLEAVKLWQARYSGEHFVRVELAEAPGMALLDLMRGASSAILVDAVEGGARSGSVHLVSEAQIERFVSGSGSAHGWGVAETLALARQLDPESLPARIAIIGIEVASFALGAPLSPSVAAALPAAAELIQQQVQRFLLV